jgi:hypothetical protein
MSNAARRVVWHEDGEAGFAESSEQFLRASAGKDEKAATAVIRKSASGDFITRVYMACWDAARWPRPKSILIELEQSFGFDV